MADAAGAAPAEGGHDGGFGRGRGRRGGRRGRRFGGDGEGAPAGDGERRGRGGRGGRRGGRRGGSGKDEEKWIPCTKLGRLVQAKRIRSIEDIYLHSLAIKEYQIVDAFFGESLKDEVMKITPVQKQTAAGQRTKFKAWIIVGDGNGHIGLGVKCAKEVAGAIRGAIIDAKLNVIPVRRGFWSTHKFGAPHTVPCKLTGKCGSVRTRLVPAPRGTGIVAGKVAKKVLTKAGIIDCYTQSKGSTKTLGNFVFATYYALAAAYEYLTPDLWVSHKLEQSPYAAHSDFLSGSKKAAGGYSKDK
jgi:small subunit ribosomal protein S2e